MNQRNQEKIKRKSKVTSCLELMGHHDVCSTWPFTTTLRNQIIITSLFSFYSPSPPTPRFLFSTSSFQIVFTPPNLDRRLLHIHKVPMLFTVHEIRKDATPLGFHLEKSGSNLRGERVNPGRISCTEATMCLSSSAWSRNDQMITFLPRNSVFCTSFKPMTMKH